MEKVILEATTRDVFGRKTNKKRKEGLIPAVIYGKGVESKSLWVKDLDLRRLLRKSGESTIISLNIDGKNGNNALIYDMQVDPVKNRYLHVDFLQVRMDEELETEVELVFVGESPAVKELGGVLIKSMDSLEIKCLPADLPSEIEVDVAAIQNFEDYIYVRDIKVPSGVEVLSDEETVVASVAPPRSEEELGKLDEKVEGDVTKVEGVVKEAPKEEGEKPEK